MSHATLHYFQVLANYDSWTLVISLAREFAIAGRHLRAKKCLSCFPSVERQKVSLRRRRLPVPGRDDPEPRLQPVQLLRLRLRRLRQLRPPEALRPSQGRQETGEQSRRDHSLNEHQSCNYSWTYKYFFCQSCAYLACFAPSSTASHPFLQWKIRRQCCTSLLRTLQSPAAAGNWTNNLNSFCSAGSTAVLKLLPKYLRRQNVVLP